MAGVGDGGRRDEDAVRGGEEEPEQIAEGVGLLARVARRLQAEGRWEGKARLPRDLERAAMRLEKEVRARRWRP